MQINDLPIHVGRGGVPSYSMSPFKSFCLYLVVTVFALFPDIPILSRMAHVTQCFLNSDWTYPVYCIHFCIHIYL